MNEKWTAQVEEKYSNEADAEKVKLLTRALARCMYTLGYSYTLARALIEVDAETGQEIKEYVKLAYTEMGGKAKGEKTWR